MKRIALITGIAGQDGSYLAELLLRHGYTVHGIVRRESIEDPERRLVNIFSILDEISLHVGSVDNQLSLYRIVSEVKPDVCYHLAASSFVSYDFDDEASVLASNFFGTHYLLSSIKEIVPDCRVYFAGSSEMFGDAEASPQNEGSRFNPRSIYGISKLSAFHLVRNYREHRDIFASTGILFNHESPRRKFEFVTRKITTTVAKIHLNMTDRLVVGNLDARRDWGYAPDYVEAMFSILNHDKPEDFVVSTGVLHSVRELLEIAFNVVELNYTKYVEVESRFMRPEGPVPLCGDSTKARDILGWKPTTNFETMIEEMVLSDIERLRR